MVLVALGQLPLQSLYLLLVQSVCRLRVVIEGRLPLLAEIFVGLLELLDAAGLTSQLLLPLGGLLSQSAQFGLQVWDLSHGLSESLDLVVLLIEAPLVLGQTAAGSLGLFGETLNLGLQI